ncbi:MAG: hypothetical protein DSO08_00635 [Candidatus Methanomethylicota archaeon]|uniref:Uncharacterized protein n=1 Tax=Thermoproteota archaeon TaxID=2056631 RepID=A0A523BHU6_9CREN|nr:MAG: hypothetical protein DSO08_00635 [Candidatus Verstraetearchaeota archaeon]
MLIFFDTYKGLACMIRWVSAFAHYMKRGLCWVKPLQQPKTKKMTKTFKGKVPHLPTLLNNFPAQVH